MDTLKHPDRYRAEEVVELPPDWQRDWIHHQFTRSHTINARPGSPVDELARYGAALLAAHIEQGGNLLDVARERDVFFERWEAAQGPLARLLRDVQRIRDVLDDFRKRTIASPDVILAIDAIVFGGPSIPTSELPSSPDQAQRTFDAAAAMVEPDPTVVMVGTIEAAAADVVEAARTLGATIGRIGAVRGMAAAAFLEGLADGVRLGGEL